MNQLSTDLDTKVIFAKICTRVNIAQSYDMMGGSEHIIVNIVVSQHKVVNKNINHLIIIQLDRK